MEYLNNGKFTKIPNYIIDQGVLALMTPCETKVYTVIARGCSNNKKICRYSIKTISDKSGIWLGTVYNAIKGLDDLKVIKTWIHKIEAGKPQVKRYFQINWEGYSMAEVFKRQKEQKKKREKITEKHKDSIKKAQEKRAKNREAKSSPNNTMSGSYSNVGQNEVLRVSV